MHQIASLVLGSGDVTKGAAVHSIHGRFQPFHNGHLNYARAALEKCNFLYVGITQVERDSMKRFDSAPHRSQVDSNPFSYFERKILIEAGLTGEGISPDKFSVIPFPIEKGELLVEFFPRNSVCFTTIHSEWNKTKIELLTDLGYDVRVLDDPDRWPLERQSATVIRELLRARDPRWKDLVPKAIANLIERDYMGLFA
jgi:cytidyltransferase-like protein